MALDSVIAPVVIAAAVSATVSLIGFLINKHTIIKLQNQKIGVDQAIAEQKIKADIDIARQRSEYEHSQTLFKRKLELAEQFMSDSYQFRLMMIFVRNGFSSPGEGESRVADGMESESVKRNRDNYFVPLKRLREEQGFISGMFARRSACRSHFGPKAERAFELFNHALHQLQVASSLLIQWSSDYSQVDRDTTQMLLHDIWQPMAKHAGKDEIGEKIESAVRLVEEICHPILSRTSISGSAADTSP